MKAWFISLLILIVTTGCFLYQREEQRIPRDESVPVDITFSPAAGSYGDNQAVTLSCNDPGATLYYTLDGSAAGPEAYTIVYQDKDGNNVTVENTAGIAYTSPIALSATALLRVRAFRGELPVSKEYNRFYLIAETTTLPVFSLVMNPLHLWDNNTGIYVPGPADTSNPFIDPYGKQNFNQDWERPINITFFETDGSLAFTMDGGARIFGGWSRGFAQKSLALFARPEYGSAAIPYSFFGTAIDRFASIVLRNSGDDWYRTMFRDAFLQSLLDGMNIDRQAYRPSIVYLNGQYWGIHNIREKINEDYLAAHYSYVDPANVDILTHYDSRIVEGDNTEFINLLDFAESNDLSQPANYAVMTAAIDMDNLIDYTIAQLYINNTDWPFSNIKFWRPRTAGGKWRWIIYDTDSGFGGKEWVPEWNSADHNSLAFLLSAQGSSDFRVLVRNLCKNSTFRAAFTDRFSDLLSTNFQPAVVTEKLDAMAAVLQAEIPRHIAKWHSSVGGSVANWETRVQTMRNYAAPRQANWSGWLATFNAAWSALVKNGTFDSGMFWTEGWVDAGKSAAFTFNDFTGDEAGGIITVQDPLPEWSDIVMFYQDDITLAAGTYQLTFDVKASATCEIGVTLINPDTWAEYNDAIIDVYYIATITAADTYEQKTVACTVPANDSRVRLLFVAGLVPAGTSVYIDNVALAGP